MREFIQLMLMVGVVVAILALGPIGGLLLAHGSRAVGWDPGVVYLAVVFGMPLSIAAGRAIRDRMPVRHDRRRGSFERSGLKVVSAHSDRKVA